MTALAFDPDAIMAEVFARAKAPCPATIATSRQSAPNCRKVANVATPRASNSASDCRNVAIVAAGDGQDDEDAGLIKERAALCVGVIPAPFLDAWSRLNHQKPIRVSDDEWRRALDDGGRFFDRWGHEAALWGWQTGELFDVPHKDRRGGLIWFIEGATVEAFGPDHARLADGRVFDRGAIGGERNG